MNPTATRAVAILVLTLFCQPAFSDIAARVVPFAAKYAVENDYLSAGSAYLKLNSIDNGGYEFSFYTKPSGFLRMMKKGKITERALLPAISTTFESTYYRYEDKSNAGKSFETTFDRQKKTATIQQNGEAKTVAISDKVTDRLSMMLTVMNRIAEQPDFNTLQIDELASNGVKSMEFTNRGLEDQTGFFGTIAAARIHNQREGSARETLTWFAADPTSGAVVPVKIEQYKSGELVLRLKLTAFSVVE